MNDKFCLVFINLALALRLGFPPFSDFKFIIRTWLFQYCFIFGFFCVLLRQRYGGLLIFFNDRLTSRNSHVAFPDMKVLQSSCRTNFSLKNI
jgi:hypothetical protein